MKYLKEELRKYYQRSNNKIVFINGQTMYELSLSIWERLGFHNFDVSQFSRIINGKALFTTKQLSAFCEVLNLGAYKRYILFDCLNKDTLIKNLGYEFETVKEFEFSLDPVLSDHIATRVKTLKDEGNLEEVLRITSFFERFFKTNPEIIRNNPLFVAKILSERARSFIHTESRYTIASKITDISTLTLELNKDLKNIDIANMAHGNYAGIFYVSKQHKKSSEYLEYALDKVEPDAQVEYLRTLLADYGQLRDYENFKRTVKRAESILSKYDSSLNKNYVASMFEASARALSLFGETDGARKILNQITFDKMEPFFESQIVRGKMSAVYYDWKYNNKVNMDELEEIYSLSNENRFKSFNRHQKQISKMYNQIHANPKSH